MIFREINDCSEFLRLMSDQWETARQCNQALSLLSAKIRQMDSPDTSQPFTYAMSTPDREVGRIDPVGIRERGRYKNKSLSNHYSYETETSPPMRMDGSLESGFQSSALHDRAADLNHGPPPMDTTPSSLEIEFQNNDYNHLAGGSNFDLNMVDLLHGANFDNLFDVIGQQYPSF